MRRAAILAAAMSASLAFAGCQDGFRQVNNRSFYVYDDDGDGFDYGMAYRACRTINSRVGRVNVLPPDDADALVECIR